MSIVITRQEKIYDFCHIFLLRSTYKIIPQYYETKKSRPDLPERLKCMAAYENARKLISNTAVQQEFFQFLDKKRRHIATIRDYFSSTPHKECGTHTPVSRHESSATFVLGRNTILILFRLGKHRL